MTKNQRAKKDKLPVELAALLDAHNIRVVCGYQGESSCRYNIEKKEYTIYISEEEANQGAIIERALREIERREGMVSA